MPTEEKIGRRPLEFGIANKEEKCDSCGRSISVGLPYMKKQTIKQVEGEFAIITTIECLVACHVYQTALSDASDEDDLPDDRPLRYDKCWESIPVDPSKDEQALRVVTKRSGHLVARAYTRIVEWSAGPQGLHRFLECEPAQINQKTFSIDPHNVDAYGNYRGWRTPDDTKAREYTRDSGRMKAGFWYLPLRHLECFAAVMVPTSNGSAVPA